MPSVTRLRLAILTHWAGNQSQLAKRCGIYSSHLTLYVRGQSAMPIEHRAILAHVLRVEPTEIDGWVPGPDLWDALQGMAS